MDSRADRLAVISGESDFPAGRSSGLGSHARWAIRWLASISLVTWLIARTAWRDVAVAFESASVVWLITAAILYLASQFASVVRWSKIVASVGIASRWPQLLAAYFEGMFMNVCMPTTIGGDVLKVLRIGRGQDKRTTACTIAVDRASGLAALLALLLLGLALQIDASRRSHLALTCYAIVLCVTLFLVHSIPRLAANAFVLAAGRRRTRAHVFFTRFQPYLPTAFRDIAVHTPWMSVFAWAFVVQSLNVAAVIAATLAVGLNVPITGILVATTTVSLVAALPLSVAGIGIREASLPLLLAAHGIPKESSIAVGIIWSGIVVLVGLVGGPIHFWQQRYHSSASRTIETSQETALVASRKVA